MRSVRACDNCIRKRARWYCAADDAFLCQSCDSLVHSANPLASRHERVLLKTTSHSSWLDVSVPMWHKGFTRKARTPRQKKPKFSNPFNQVPETCSDENSHEENDEQLLYRVPTLDEFGQESAQRKQVYSHRHDYVDNLGNDGEFSQEMNHLQGILESDMDLDEFAADVESLLGKGLKDPESFDMEGLGFLDCDDRMKVEEDEINGEFYNHRPVDNSELLMIDMGKETFELNFDFDSPIIEEEDIKVWNEETSLVNNCEDCNSKKRTFLRIDYQGVLSAWNHQKSPWTTGERPEFGSGESWPDCMGTYGTMHVLGEAGMFNGHAMAMADVEREARVSRYREKRRTRLFSKKIRYEVRKLNAEKRPRMKGRFVKRANLVAPAFPLLNKQNFNRQLLD